MTPQEIFDQLKDIHPVTSGSKGIYKSCITVDRLVYTSGHVPFDTAGNRIKGTVGLNMDTETAKAVARNVGMCILQSLIKEYGSLNSIKRVIKVFGMVNAVPDYNQHPIVINGCSELFREIWGDDLGVGVRSAVGMGSLPDNVPVEIEAVFELDVRN
ncbi:MAG: RidA family protein [Chitinophagia bacterium]|jgi:enamine deaminase RidA (YjgF/YER057c/UK114 family)